MPRYSQNDERLSQKFSRCSRMKSKPPFFDNAPLLNTQIEQVPQNPRPQKHEYARNSAHNIIAPTKNNISQPEINHTRVIPYRQEFPIKKSAPMSIGALFKILFNFHPAHQFCKIITGGTLATLGAIRPLCHNDITCHQTHHDLLSLHGKIGAGFR